MGLGSEQSTVAATRTHPEDAAVSSGDDAGDEELDGLRARIDELDTALIGLLNERAQVVVRVGELKRGTDTPIYAPAREAEVLQRVLDANQGPLPDRTVEGIYRELMSGSFALEQPLRIAFLGPAGSFSPK